MDQTTHEGHSIVVGEYEDAATVAVVIGTAEQAQAVADRWNLDNIEQIAGAASHGYARVGDGTGNVHTPRPGGAPDIAAQVGDRVEITITGTVAHVYGGKHPSVRIELDSDIVVVDDEDRVTTHVIPGADRITVLPATD